MNSRKRIVQRTCAVMFGVLLLIGCEGTAYLNDDGEIVAKPKVDSNASYVQQVIDLTSTGFEEIGVGYAVGKYGTSGGSTAFWVQNFGAQ